LVTATEVEYEVDAQLDEQRLTLHFHPRCYDAWKTESEAALAAEAGINAEADIEAAVEAPRAKTSP
jgi:hypothetical protein